MQRWRQVQTVAACVRSRVDKLKPKVIEPQVSIRILSVALLEGARPDLMVSHNLMPVRYVYGNI